MPPRRPSVFMMGMLEAVGGHQERRVKEKRKKVIDSL
jgi:hypothetical protein